MVGLNGAVAYGAVFASSEVQTEHITNWIRRIAEENLHSVAVRPEATRRYNEQIQAELQAMSWTGDCPNFYRDPTGRIVSFFPGTVGRLRRELRNAPDHDFVITR